MSSSDFVSSGAGSGDDTGVQLDTRPPPSSDEHVNELSSDSAPEALQGTCQATESSVCNLCDTSDESQHGLTTNNGAQLRSRSAVPDATVDLCDDCDLIDEIEDLDDEDWSLILEGVQSSQRAGTADMQATAMAPLQPGDTQLDVADIALKYAFGLQAFRDNQKVQMQPTASYT